RFFLGRLFRRPFDRRNSHGDARSRQREFPRTGHFAQRRPRLIGGERDLIQRDALVARLLEVLGHDGAPQSLLCLLIPAADPSDVDAAPGTDPPARETPETPQEPNPGAGAPRRAQEPCPRKPPPLPSRAGRGEPARPHGPRRRLTLPPPRKAAVCRGSATAASEPRGREGLAPPLYCRDSRSGAARTAANPRTRERPARSRPQTPPGRKGRPREKPRNRPPSCAARRPPPWTEKRGSGRADRRK